METDIDLKTILDLVRRQFFLIGSTIAIVLALTLVITFLLTPKYTASVLLMVDTSSKNLLEPSNSLANPNADTSRMESEVGILRSDHILLAVVRDNGLVSDPEFGIQTSLKERLSGWLGLSARPALSAQDAMTTTLNAFKPAVTVDRNGLTYLMTVSVTSSDPAKAATLANAISDTYIREQIDAKVTATLLARDTLRKQVEAADAAIVAHERSFDRHVDDAIDRLDKQANPIGLASLRTELETMEQDRAANGLRLETLRRALQVNDFATLSSTFKTEVLTSLQQRRDTLSAEIAAGGNDAKTTGLRAQLLQADRALSEAATTQLQGLEQTIAQADQRADDIRREIRASIVQGDLPPEILTGLYGLQQSALIARTQYTALLSRLRDVEAQSTLQLADSRVVSAALAPTSASFPNRLLIFGISLIAATGLGLGLAVLREYFIGGFVSETQLETVLRIPLSAIAPRQAMNDDIPASAGKMSSLADLMVTAPLSLYSESIRRLRLTLDQQERTGPAIPGDATIILVSSALPAEGKSTVALSLARAYALTGKRTLLIDCDLRKPDINKQLHLDPSHDFIDYLRHDRSLATLTSLIMRDPLSGLTVLPGGRRSDIATDELVMSEKMGRLLSGAAKHFDYLVLDTPPIEPVVDALYLARHADLIVFVIQWARTPQSSAKRAVAALKDNMNPRAGIVTLLNQHDRIKAAVSNRDDGGYHGAQ